MATSTVEDYVKQIYLIEQERGDPLVPMGRLSEAMKITPGTTTTMMKSLAADGLVVYELRVGVRLTDMGRQLALKMLRRHRIAESFLVQVLGMDWSEVHDDAERLEHAISDQVLDRMDALLERPTHDPHGDPIPRDDGRIERAAVGHLAQVPVGEPVTVVRILDQSPAFLSYVREAGLVPGAALTVEARGEVADALMVRLGSSHPIALSIRVAEKIAVS
jgi:DtxR family Mn-dependent transcriptional regulator